MHLVVDSSSFIEADPLGDELCGHMIRLFEILEMPIVTLGKLSGESSAKYQDDYGECLQGVCNHLNKHGTREMLYLSHDIPRQDSKLFQVMKDFWTNWDVYLLGDFISAELYADATSETTRRQHLILTSAVSLPFEILYTALHPKFSDVSKLIVKPLIELKRKQYSREETLQSTLKSDRDLGFVDSKTTIQIDPSKSRIALFVCDVQDRILKGLSNVSESGVKELVDHIGNCITWAHKTPRIDLVVTAQIPEKLGPVNSTILEALKPPPASGKSTTAVVPKTSFSAGKYLADYDTVIITGIETHICILLTALELTGNQQAIVVRNAIASSTPFDDWIALLRLGKRPNVRVIESVDLIEISK
ncbi:putative isochorismatase family hydrolase [Gregarina niphandrodes]|uniref:Isochorismatase family hydrolase n=1 Tax=Gregarina niphandrodes TaxID=110365 RepID=A0A023BB69_GRENI|nr:putative isochorismatase family hydrolase [Gregarina niphandrodes]EZG79245.1 putative isochorismatase family hydrolase [Gregarina niphandrodes]|eukprot:XP_011129092.1 putative isochorismatase family hydrolase [Gregarina niphandrodes]